MHTRLDIGMSRKARHDPDQRRLAALRRDKAQRAEFGDRSRTRRLAKTSSGASHSNLAQMLPVPRRRIAPPPDDARVCRAHRAPGRSRAPLVSGGLGPAFDRSTKISPRWISHRIARQAEARPVRRPRLQHRLGQPPVERVVPAVILGRTNGRPCRPPPRRRGSRHGGRRCAARGCSPWSRARRRPSGCRYRSGNTRRPRRSGWHGRPPAMAARRCSPARRRTLVGVEEFLLGRDVAAGLDLGADGRDGVG